MHQRRVVRILDVLEHQLPVRGNRLVRIAKHPQRSAVEEPVEERQHRRTQVLLQRFDVFGERREDHAVSLGNLESPQAVLAEVEVRRHAALLAISFLERYAQQVAGEIVGPPVIGTGEFADVAVRLLAELHATVGATVLDDMDRAGSIAHDDDGTIADCRPPEIATVRHFRGEPHIRPHTAAEDAVLLAPVDFLARVRPVRHARDSLARPAKAGGWQNFIPMGGHEWVLQDAGMHSCSRPGLFAGNHRSTTERSLGSKPPPLMEAGLG